MAQKGTTVRHLECQQPAAAWKLRINLSPKVALSKNSNDESSGELSIQSKDALERLSIRAKSHTEGAACSPLVIYLSLIVTKPYQGTISPYSLVCLTEIQLGLSVIMP